MNMRINILSRFLSSEIEIPNTNLILRKPAAADFKQWYELRSQSQNFLRHWEPKWPENDLSIEGYNRRMRNYASGFSSGKARSYFLHDTAQRELLGGLSLTRIEKKKQPASALLGYWMGEPHANKGYMQKAVPVIVNYAFKKLGLKAIEAAVLPRNERSIHLLGKCGFEETGFHEKYLEINGVKEDHILFTILHSDFKSEVRRNITVL